MNDLGYVQGRDNAPGLVDQIWIVEAEAVTTPLPTLTGIYGSIANGEGVVDQLLLSGNIALSLSRKFGRVYFTDGSGRVEIKVVGARDSKGTETMITFRYPTINKDSLQMMNRLKNGPLVLIYRQRSNSRLYVCGLQAIDQTNTVLVGPPVYLDETTANTGGAPEDENGITFSFKWNANHGPLEYTGTIDVTP